MACKEESHIRYICMHMCISTHVHVWWHVYAQHVSGGRPEKNPQEWVLSSYYGFRGSVLGCQPYTVHAYLLSHCTS